MADGIFTHGIDGGYIKYVVSQIKKGAERSGRSLEAFDLATWIYPSTSTRSERVKRAFKIYTAWLAESLPEEAILYMDLEEDALERVRK